MVDTIVHVDGEYFIEVKNDKEFVINLELEDGNHSIEFISSNQNKDTTKETIYFTTDTESPMLQIDSPSVSEVVEGQSVVIEGLIESGSKLYINDILTMTNADGSFAIDYVIDEELIGETVTIKARDKAGNETIYVTELINGDVSPLVNIQIDESSLSGRTGSKDQIKVTAEDESGKIVTLNNKDLEFSFIKGSTLAGLDGDGEISYYDTGRTTIMATYALRDKYYLSDAAEVEIKLGIDELVILPEVERIDVGSSVNMSAVAQTKYGESVLANSEIVFSIVSGAEYVTLNGNIITGINPGIAVVKAVYSEDGIYKETTSSFIIRLNGSSDNGQEDREFIEAESITIIDTILTGIWENLVEREQNLEIISVRKIGKSNNTKITLYDIGVLEILDNTVDEDDVFLSGIVRDVQLNKEDRYIFNSEIYEFTFKRSGGQLNQEMTLRLKVDFDKIINSESLGIYVYNELFNKWQLIGGELINDEISVKLEHLSKYAVLENLEDSPFMDISNNWAIKYINSLKSLDVVEGSLSGGYRYFAPEDNITRIELAAMAVRVYESTSGITPLSDEELEEIPLMFMDEEEIPVWGINYAKKAYLYGLIEGVINNGKRVFEAKSTASRAEAMTILSRAIEVKETSSNILFTDSGSIPDWAKMHIYNLYQLGIVNGYSDGTIRASNNITRDEIAKLMYYWIETEVIEGKSYEE